MVPAILIRFRGDFQRWGGKIRCKYEKNCVNVNYQAQGVEIVAVFKNREFAISKDYGSDYIP